MSAAPWWRANGALDRFLADLLFAEAQALRPGGPWPLARDFVSGAMLGEAGLGFDSLERTAMAAAFSEALFLHRGGLDGTLVTQEQLGVWSAAARAALDQFSGAVCFRSSGSTGARRRHVHAMAELEAEMAFFASLLAGRRRVLVAIPCHHIYGFLFTLILPARLGAAVLDVRDRFPGARALRPGDLVVGHPGFWAELCRAAPDEWPADVVGVTSGAPCPDRTAAAATRAGLARLLQVYGASETGGIGWRDAPGAPYRLLPAWRAVEDGARLQRGDAPPVEAPDRLRWLDAERFIPEGRRDAAVQVGGVNVYPGHVRDVLRMHPAVADAAVRPMAPHEGNRLKAFIVPRDPAASPAALREELDRHAALRLSIAERPRAFSFGRALPQTPAGKPADWPAPDG